MIDAQSLKDDFLEWTGGFEPEDDSQIESYIKSSMPASFDDDEARRVLLDWLRSHNGD